MDIDTVGMDLSIVVLAWEDIDETRRCVRSLPAGAEIVVVDNGSATHIRDAIEELCTEVGAVYVQTGANLGYARGMNAGAAKASRSTLILANNDVIVHDGAVDRLVAALADPGVGLAFPRVVDQSGHEETAAGRFLTVPVGLGHATGLSMLARRLRIVAEPARADWLTGPFVAMSRTTYDAVGGVDESSEFYAEDLRLCWAVRRRRLRIAYVPDAVIEHLGDASSQRRWSTEEISRRQTREFIRAARQLGGRGSGLASAAYVAGAVWRAGLARDPVRRAIARGAIEGMRAG
jgi:N-acetylglucosaminyl-diphospho-decaprenol L-rhamnosyltransferase